LRINDNSTKQTSPFAIFTNILALELGNLFDLVLTIFDYIDLM